MIGALQTAFAARPHRRLRWGAAITGLALLGTACGAEVDDTERTAAGFPVTVTNCGQELTFTAPPQRTVANDINITEMMFALGLADRMAGYAVEPEMDRDIASSQWRADFAAVPRLGDEITMEMAQAADADLVFAGWDYGFSEATGVTPDALAAVGIDSYQLTEACRHDGATSRGVMDPFEALFTDLRDLGKIHDADDRAAELIAGYRQILDSLDATAPDGRPTRVFVYDGGTDQPMTSGANAAAEAIITRAGGENIFGDIDDSWTTVSFEAAADRDPELVLIVDFGEGPEEAAEAKMDTLRGHPLMSGTTAVREDNFFVLSYAALTEGPRNPQAAADLAAHLRADTAPEAGAGD